MQRRGIKGVFSHVAPGSNEKTEEVDAVLRAALLKTRKNLFLGREGHPLTSAENKSLYRPFTTTHWIDPSKIVHGLNWPAKKGHLIVYDGTGRLDVFAQHSTSIFIRELILENKPMEETTLYKRMSNRRWVRPVILGGKRVKIPLNSHENMKIYFDKCRSLIKSIQDSGVEGFVERSKIENIGLALTFEGRITHYRVGHHRLAIAQALGIKKIPMDILLVSAKFLAEKLLRWRLWSSSAMVRAVDEVLRDRVEKFSAEDPDLGGRVDPKLQ